MGKLTEALNSMDQKFNQIKTEAFENLAKLSVEKLKSIQAEIAREITPIAQKMMVDNYKASGEGVITGDLLRAISRCTVSPSQDGFTYIIAMPGGLPQRLYIAGSVAKHGALLHAKGLSGKRKKALKKVVAKAGSKDFIAPKPLFMGITGSQVNELRDAIDVLYRLKVKREGIE